MFQIMWLILTNQVNLFQYSIGSKGYGKVVTKLKIVLILRFTLDPRRAV